MHSRSEWPNKNIKIFFWKSFFLYNYNYRRQSKCMKWNASIQIVFSSWNRAPQMIIQRADLPFLSKWINEILCISATLQHFQFCFLVVRCSPNVRPSTPYYDTALCNEHVTQSLQCISCEFLRIFRNKKMEWKPLKEWTSSCEPFRCCDLMNKLHRTVCLQSCSMKKEDADWGWNWTCVRQENCQTKIIRRSKKNNGNAVNFKW